MQSVLFDVLPKPGHVEEYFSMAAQLKPIVEQNPGFISVERFANLQNHDWYFVGCIGSHRSRLVLHAKSVVAAI